MTVRMRMTVSRCSLLMALFIRARIMLLLLGGKLGTGQEKEQEIVLERDKEDILEGGDEAEVEEGEGEEREEGV